MKVLRLFLSSIPAVLNLSAQELPQEPVHLFSKPENLSIRYESDVLDSVIDWVWNTDNAVWDLEIKHVFFYDDEHYLLEDQTLFWTGTAWNFAQRLLWQYDDHYNVINLLAQSWDGFQWINSNQRIYQYDGQDHEISNFYQFWNGAGWENGYLTTTAYNPDGEKLRVINQVWDQTEWGTQAKDTFEYVNHVLASATSSLFNDITGWVYYLRYLYTYQDGNLIERIYQNWDGVDWTDQYKYQYTFDGNGNNTYYLQQRFESGAWTNRFQTFFEHTAFDEVYAEHGDQWISNAWRNYHEYSAQFDSRENLDIESNKFWDTTWVNTDSAKYYYTFASSLDKAIAQNPGFTISPNPAANQIFLHFDTVEQGEVQYRIYSLDGKLLETAKLDSASSRPINVSQYNTGSYILQVRIEDQWRMKVFVKK